MIRKDPEESFACLNLIDTSKLSLEKLRFPNLNGGKIINCQMLAVKNTTEIRLHAHNRVISIII